ncbi:Rho termination factor N-terminal domain-containing protein [Bernardetia sp. ABR2-2B]|uniref:Rho termination factor N-terminal domain-containing protein n=1 Tax=Bernardetia sp. ABR2-2B TaxID=3127472 RepID=UPI0030CF31DB
MIIKSLLEIAFYSSLLVAKKVGSTIEENLPFSEKKVKPVALRTVIATPKEEEKEVIKKEKGAKKVTPKEEAKIMNYSLKTKKELYEIAQEIDLEGRSTMNKAELLKALQAHSKK